MTKDYYLQNNNKKKRNETIRNVRPEMRTYFWYTDSIMRSLAPEADN